MIVGSGAGGGTLGNELAQKGIDVVLLEAGKRASIDKFQSTTNGQASCSSPGSTSAPPPATGGWRKDFPNLPAWICKTVGGTTTHWAGASLRFQEHEFKAKTTYGDIAGANLLDWPMTLAELEPYYAKAEDKMGVTRTNGIPGLPGNNNFKVLDTGAKRLGYKEVHTGRMAINSQPRDGRGSCQQIGFCFQGCKIGRQMVDALHRDPEGRATPASSSCGRNRMVLQIQHDDTGKVTGVLYADKDGKQQVQKARIVCVAGNSIESPRLLLNSASAKFPDGLANSSGQVGRNYMRHTTGSVYADLRRSRCTCIAARPWPASSRTRRATTRARLRRRLRAGDAVARPAVHGGVPRSRRLGPRLHLGTWSNYANMAGMWIVGEDMPQENNRRHAARRPRRTSSACRSRTSISTTTRTTSRCAATPIRQGTAVYEAVGATRGLRDAALSLDPQSRHQPDEREAARRRGATSTARPTTSRTCSSPTAASSPPAAPRTRR